MCRANPVGTKTFPSRAVIVRGWPSLWNGGCTHDERAPPGATSSRDPATAGLARRNWTIHSAGGNTIQRIRSKGRDHETVFPQNLHVVERPDLWHPALDLAVRRTGRRG